MMRKIVVALLMWLLALSTYATEPKEPVYQGCGGGMMFHAGYLFASNPTTAEVFKPSGVSFGLGGQARVLLWKHLRIGGEGFVSNMPISASNAKQYLPGSYIRTGCGGLIADACWRMEKVWPFVGAGVGGGAKRELYVLEGSIDDYAPDKTIYHKQGFCYVNPCVGVEYRLTEKINLSFRFDWLIAFANHQILQPTGPRFYVGILFCH